jgi:tetratricopeptide (TPR) repeat protein
MLDRGRGGAPSWWAGVRATRAWRWTWFAIVALAAFLAAWLGFQLLMDLDAGTAVGAATAVDAILLLPLGTWAGRDPEPVPVPLGPVVVVRRPLRNRHFVGRDDLLDRMRDGLRASSPVAVQALHGLGGVGKTQLAVEYTHRFSADYDLIWWIDAERPALIPAQYRMLARAIDVPVDAGDPVPAVCAALSARSRWLLVFDNAERPDDLLPLLPADGHVLITSRNPGWGALALCLDVDVLTRPESVALLTGRITGIGDATADAVAEQLGDLPLALEQAAAYVEETRLPAPEYLRLLRTRADELLAEGHVLGRRHTVATVWDLSLRRLESTCPAASTLLTLCAFLGPEPIPLDLFTGRPGLTEAHDGGGMGPAGVDGGRGLLPEPLDRAAADEVKFTGVVAALVRFGLARRSGTGIVVHRLTQAATRRPVTGPARAAVHRTLVGLLAADLMASPRPCAATPRCAATPHVSAATPDRPDRVAADRPMTDPRGSRFLHSRAGALERSAASTPHTATPEQARWSALLPHVLYLAAAMPAGGDTVDQGTADGDTVDRGTVDRGTADGDTADGDTADHLALLLDRAAIHLHDAGAPYAARTLLERSLAIGGTGREPGDPSVAARLGNLALLLRDLGDPAAARPLLERSLAAAEAAYGPDHPVVATGLSNLALVLADLGEPAAARPLLERSLAVDETARGPEDPAVAVRLANLAVVERDLGDLAAARRLLERAVAIAEAGRGPGHPTVATHLANLGEVLRELGDPASACALLERAVTIGETRYGPEHPSLATALANLALARRDTGDVDAARSLLERALTVDEAAYGRANPVRHPPMNNSS